MCLLSLSACSSVGPTLPGIPFSVSDHCEKAAATTARTAPEARDLSAEKRACLEVRLQERCLARMEKVLDVRKKRPDAPGLIPVHFPGEWDHALAGDSLSDLNEHPACSDSKVRKAAMEAESAIGARLGDRWETFGNRAVNRSRDAAPTWDFESFIPAKAADFNAPREAQEVWAAWRNEAITEARALASSAYLMRSEGRLDEAGAKCIAWTRMARASGASTSLIDARAALLGKKLRTSSIETPAWVKDTTNRIQDEAEGNCDDSDNLGVRYMRRTEEDARLEVMRSEADKALVGMLRLINNAKIIVETAASGGLSPASLPLPFVGGDLVEKYRPNKGYDGPL
ncbi:MAG: hypothetical protein EOO72_03430 [Myxococcaceae bacterium]|nr:MAG: hypothetical protein EOO72_03430 [Myxococcaceae bacterium]